MAYTCVYSHGSTTIATKSEHGEMMGQWNDTNVRPPCSDPKRYNGRMYCLTDSRLAVGGSDQGWRDHEDHSATSTHNVVLLCPVHAAYETY